MFRYELKKPFPGYRLKGSISEDLTIYLKKNGIPHFSFDMVSVKGPISKGEYEIFFSEFQEEAMMDARIIANDFKGVHEEASKLLSILALYEPFKEEENLEK